MVGDIMAARTVFERWMKCFPGEDAWAQYIKFEERCGRIEAARKLYERMIEQIPEQIVSRKEIMFLCLWFFVFLLLDGLGFNR